jgi:D-tyrosyl-tRNA(Tyr) deacylase
MLYSILEKSLPDRFNLGVNHMRAVIQRVIHASVQINGTVYSSINKGLLILLGIENADEEDDIEWLTGKIMRLRIFNDGNGIMNLSVTETGGSIMVVSQFTLHASTKKGNRPSYIRAAKPEKAIDMYESFVKRLKKDWDIEVKTGEFAADMKVNLINDGPVTIIIDTKNKE